MSHTTSASSAMTKWVSCWGNATSITDRSERTYSKDLTLRYRISICFDGRALRMRLSNLTGTEPVVIDKMRVARLDESGKVTERKGVTMCGKEEITIPAGQEVTTDEVTMDLHRGDNIDVSLYLKGFTQMNAGTLITGPLSKGQFCYGCHVDDDTLPAETSRRTNWFYFLNTIDILTHPENRALICYGDSITAQSWPDYLTLRCRREGFKNVAIIRRAVSGTRILRQYDCITYQAYGLKGATRFPIEANVAGAEAVIIQHGINDIIHPVGTDVNPFRPWSDLPTVKEMAMGIADIYVAHARALGLKVWSGTLLPIRGWRTFNDQREAMRCDFNVWARTSTIFDGCVDFDKAVRDEADPSSFRKGFDSGDHLHPSEAAYEAMAEAVPEELLK